MHFTKTVLFFLLGLALSGCSTDGTIANYETYEKLETTDILEILHTRGFDELKGELQNKKFVISGLVLLYFKEQYLVLSEKEFKDSGATRPHSENCLQLLVPDQLIKKYSSGELGETKLFGKFISFGGDLKDGDTLLFKYEGVSFYPWCDISDYLFFYVERIEKAQK